MITTIQITTKLRDEIKAGASKRAEEMGINKLSMIDYLQLIMKEESK